MNAAEALKLVALTYRGCEYNLSNPHSRWIVWNELKDCLHTFAHEWNLVWGPSGYRPGAVGLDISAMYAASSDSNLAIVIRGTNLFSVVDWLSNLPLDLNQWEYGGAPSGVNISLSTWLGLRLLQRLQCGAIPTHDPGESLSEKLEAAAAKVQGAAGYALIQKIVQGAPELDAAKTLAEIGTHIGAAANSSFTVDHIAALQHAIADARQPVPTFGTLLEYLRTFIAGATVPANVYVIGHSKSGALAPAFAQWLSDIALHWDPRQKAKLYVFTFAGPTPGNDRFADRYQHSAIDETRVANTYDVVPHVWQSDEMRQISGLYADQLNDLKNPLNNWATTLESYHYQHEVATQQIDWDNVPQSNFLQRIAFEHLNAYLKKFQIYNDEKFNILKLFAPIAATSN